MILDRTELSLIFKEKRNSAQWIEAAKRSTVLAMHVNGEGLDKHLSTIEQHENEKQAKVRKKYTRSNRDLFARYLRPIDHIWEARGGALVFVGTQAAAEKRIRTLIADVRDGYGFRAWVKNFWLPRLLTDPMGLVFMEVGIERTYPTYKATKDIFSAVNSGRRLEYVIFKTPDPTVFRVVDDLTDRFVEWKDDKLRDLSGKKYPSFPNYFGRVPALIISDIPKDGRVDAFASPIEDEVELADVFLREGSITSIYRLKHGFPNKWKYPEVCGTCKGAKAVSGLACPDCNATGIKTESKPGDVTVFAWPEKDAPEIGEKGGYISPDLEYLKYADESLLALEKLMFRTHWGTYLQEGGEGGESETATGRFIDAQPVEKRLGSYAGAAESTEEFIINAIALFHLSIPNAATNSIGRRFLVESPDVLWKKYEDARAKGGSEKALTDLLRDYYETKLQNNRPELERTLKELALEPAVHLSIKEAKAALPFTEYVQKVVFTRFMQSIEPVYFMNAPLKKLIEELRAFAESYAGELMVDPMAPPPVPEGAPGAKPAGPKPAPGKPKPAPAPTA